MTERPEAEGDVAVAEIDDILGEIGVPAWIEGADGLSAIAEPAYSLEDILGDFDALEPAVTDDGVDDILSEIGAPVQAEPAESLDDIPSASAPLSAQAADAPDEVLDAVDATPPEAQANAVSATDQTEAVQTKRRAALPKLGLPSLGGTHQISRKAHLTLIGLTGLFGLTTAAETAFIVVHQVGKSDANPKALVVTMAPVDYAHIDLKRYIGKRRALQEGGRDVLRNGAVKSAILDLDSGEDLYRDIRAIARRSPVADHMTIGGDRLLVASCDIGVCGDKSFRLVYDLVRQRASVCITEKYLNNSSLSYSYSEEGFSEVPGCR